MNSLSPSKKPQPVMEIAMATLFFSNILLLLTFRHNSRKYIITVCMSLLILSLFHCPPSAWAEIESKVFNPTFYWNRRPDLPAIGVDNDWHVLLGDSSYSAIRYKFDAALYPRVSLQFSFPISIVAKWDKSLVKPGSTVYLMLKAVPQDQPGKEFISVFGPSLKFAVQKDFGFLGWLGPATGLDFSVNLQKSTVAPFNDQTFTVTDTLSFVNFTNLITGGDWTARLSAENILKGFAKAFALPKLATLNLVAGMKIKGKGIMGKVMYYGAGTVDEQQINIYRSSSAVEGGSDIDWSTVDIPIPANAKAGDKIGITLSLKYVLDYYYTAGARANLLGQGIGFYGAEVDVSGGIDNQVYQSGAVGDALGWKGPIRIKCPTQAQDDTISFELNVLPGEDQPQPATGSVVINDGDYSTGFRDIDVDINYSSQVKKMKFGVGQAAMKQAPLEPVVPHKKVTLPGVSAHYHVYVRLCDENGEKIMKVMDNIYLNIADANLEDLSPCQAFPEFRVYANAIQNIERLGILYRRKGTSQWNLMYTFGTPQNNRSYSVPCELPLNQEYEFGLRVWDQGYRYRDFVSPDQIKTTIVKPHNLEVTATPLSYSSAKFQWKNQCNDVFSCYALYVSDEPNNINVQANQKLISCGSMNAWQGPPDLETTVTGLIPDTHYYYVLKAVPKSQAQQVVYVSGEFYLPDPGKNLNLRYEITGPNAIIAEWDNPGELPNFAKYRLAILRNGEQEPTYHDITDQQATSYNISGLEQGVVYTMLMEIWNQTENISESQAVFFTLEEIPLPDLTVSDLQISQEDVAHDEGLKPGHWAQLSFKVKNLGEADVSSYKIMIYYRPPQGDDSRLDKIKMVSGAPIGHGGAAQEDFSCAVQLPSNLAVGGAIEVWVDASHANPEGSIIESNEENNSSVFNVTKLYQFLPDLHIFRLDVKQGGVISQGSLEPSALTQFNVYLQNLTYNTEAEDFIIAIYHRPQGSDDSQAVQLYSETITTPLPSGTSRALGCALRLPQSIQEGDTIEARIDSENNVNESDETNNTAVFNVTDVVQTETVESVEDSQPTDQPTSAQESAEQGTSAMTLHAVGATYCQGI